jgi:NAD(P)-dependent dehydrogenase (short-subunit alcohol dehydrogenase family)
MRLAGKVVIVTGAARNIGQVYAVGLSREGAKIVAVDILDCQETAGLIEQAGGEVLPLRVDVTADDSVRQMARSAHEHFGRIDGLINNAAIFHDIVLKPFFEIPEDEWDRLMSVNIKGPFLCAKAVFPYMKEQGNGRIINIGSNTAYKGTQGFLHYVTSKAGIVGLTRALARECGPYGINVNTVAPDYIPHERDDQERPDHDLMIQQQRIIQRRQTPEDVLGAIIFLLSTDADFITGQSLLVNGGIVLH